MSDSEIMEIYRYGYNNGWNRLAAIASISYKESSQARDFEFRKDSMNMVKMLEIKKLK